MLGKNSRRFFTLAKIRPVIQGIFMIFFIVLFIRMSYPFHQDFTKNFFFNFDPLIAFSIILSGTAVMTGLLVSVVTVVLTVLFGRVFCGWVCPMGAVQHFVYRKETGKKRKFFNVGPRLHNVLRYGKYVVLVALIIVVVVTQTKVCERIDPFKALFNIQLVLIPTSILVVLMAVSLVIGFPWCKYVCPLGAFLALFSKFTLFKVKIGDKCTNCKACHMVFCDYMAIKPGEVKPEINQLECTRCGECISRCPYNAMEFTV